jgi:hypothetical protein
MQEGGQMAEQVMAQPQQESVDPAIQQISDFISQAITEGQNPAEVVMSLVQQQVDQQVIGQALMMNGFEENDIMSLFQELSQGQQVEEQAGGEPFPSANLNQTPEQLTEDTSMHSDEMSAEETDEPGLSMGKSGIEIKPENEGKFTRWAQARGMSVQEAASKVMANTDEYPPAVVKMANFAKNAAGWNKEYGGESYQTGGAPQGRVSTVNNVSTNQNMNWQMAPLYMNPMAFEYSNDNFSLGKAAAVAYGGYKEFLSGKENEQGVKEGFFRDTKKKAGLKDARKGDYYNYKITQDPNDPNKYMADNLDLFYASKNKGSLRTPEQYVKDIAANSRFNYNTDTHDYDFITSSRPIDKRIYDSAGQKNALKGKDYNYLLNMDPDTKAMIMGGKDDLAGVRMGIDEYGRGMSYLPGSKNPYEYNTYMGINKVGQSSMIPTGDNGQPIAAMTTSPAIPGIPGSMMGATPSGTAPNVPQKSFRQWYSSGDATRNQGKSQQQLQSEYDAYLSQGYKYGGDLDKAQVGPPNWLAGMVNQNNYYDQSQQQGINDFFSNMGQTNYMQDTQAVANAQLQNRVPALGATPQQQQMQSMFTPQQGVPTLNNSNTPNPNINYEALNNFKIGEGINDNASLSYGDPYAKDGVNFEMPTETAMTTTDQYGNGVTPKPAFGQPKVERTNKFEGGLNRLADSRFVQGYGKLSNFAVQGAGVINDWFRDRAVNRAREDNFNKLGADYQYATAEDPFNKRGMWDVNTGTAGSEGDRTVGLYMNSKYGGENKTMEVDSNLLAKLIAAGADIEIL